MYSLNTLGQKRVRDNSEMPFVCSWGRVYSDRSNCHLMVLWFRGCLFPAFPCYHIWDAEHKSSPANTDLKSSNKDHNIRSASSVEQPPERRSGLRKGRACLSECGGCSMDCSQRGCTQLPGAPGKAETQEDGQMSYLKPGSESSERQHNFSLCFDIDFGHKW